MVMGRINRKQWVDVAVVCTDTFRRNSGQKAYSALFQLSLFKLVHAYIHETGHLIQTFLGHGQQDTPPQASGGRQTRRRGEGAGEAGEFMERALFAGLVDFYRDSSKLGQQNVNM
jgi:hypothetical protein